MADITTYPLVRHLRGTPTLHVRHLRRGKLVHDTIALAWGRRVRDVVCERTLRLLRS